MKDLRFLLEEDDDFSASSHGVDSGKAFYKSYLQAKKLMEQIPKKEQGPDPELTLAHLLREVHSTRNHHVALYRKKIDAKEALTTLWLSKVKLHAKMFASLNKLPAFRGLTSEDLQKLAKLTPNESAIPHVASKLNELGIIVIYEQAIPGMKLDGAVFMLEPGYPVVALSLRYARVDSYWFTLMHELAHIVLHRDLLNIPIVDDFDNESEELTEKQADRLALNSLVSKSDWRSCPAKYDLSPEAIYAFAEKVQAHPAIIAGRLRRELNKHNMFSEIVNRINVREMLLGHE